MGMYTEFIIDVKLKDSTPKEVIDCIDCMMGNIDNSLFTYRRNPLNNYCGSETFEKSFEDLQLRAHGDIKNYWSDIERFVDFLKPYIETGLIDNGVFAKSLYEEFDEWELYYA